MFNHQLPRHWRLLPILLAGILFLAACGSQPEAAGTAELMITSASEAASSTYLLTGTVQTPGSGAAEMEYQLNGADWQSIAVASTGTFSVTLTLNEGANTIRVALIPAAGDRVEETLSVTVRESRTPRILITSDSQSSMSSYRLTGLAIDDFGIASATYQLNDADPVALAVADGGNFAVTFELPAGDTDITVTATDEAGNTGSETLTVNYEPQITGVSATPMIAQVAQTVTLTGQHFGDQPGSVLFGGMEADILSWTGSEVTVTVPLRNPGGWQDVELIGTNSSFLIPDFFVGIELTDPNLSIAIAEAEPPRGSALLLSGSDYFLTQPTDTSSPNFLAPYSLYGARTDGEPTTQLRSANGMLLLRSSSAQAITIRDLAITAHGVRIRNEAVASYQSVSDAAAMAPPGLYLQNVRFTNQADPGLDARNATLNIGPDNRHSPVLSELPVVLSATEVHVSGFREFTMAGLSTFIERSFLESGLFSSLIAYQGWLELTESTVQSNNAANMFSLMGRGGVRAEHNEIDVQSGSASFGWRYGTEHPTLVLQDNSINVTATHATTNLTGGTGSVVKGNQLFTYNLDFNWRGSGSVVSQNTFDAGEIELSLNGGELTATGNTFAYTEYLFLSAQSDADMTFQSNQVSGPGTTHFRGDMSIVSNSFDFSGINPDIHALRLSTDGATDIAFTGNHTAGSDRLFLINGAGGDLLVTMSDNEFDADLTAAGSVAELSSLTAASLISTSRNVWGQLESADEVRDLVSGPGQQQFLVAEF